MNAPSGLPTSSRRAATVGLALLALLVATFLAGPYLGRLTDERYVDARAFLGVPNFLNVVSNLPFLLVGVAGLALCAGPRRPLVALLSWRVFYAGMALTCFGSVWFHLAPSDATIVWDRLGMVTAFVGLFFAVLEEGSGIAVRAKVAVPALVLGVASVLWWRHSGDLRPYAWVQLAPLACALTTLVRGWLTPPLRGAIAASLALYAAAKLAEMQDAGVYLLTAHALSGHTLKHLLAAAAAAVILYAQSRRGREGFADAASARPSA